jgi:hypothetical protein
MSVRVRDNSTNIYRISQHFILSVNCLEIEIAQNLMSLSSTLFCNSDSFE